MTAEHELKLSRLMLSNSESQYKIMAARDFIDELLREAKMARDTEMLEDNARLRERIVELVKDGMEQKVFYETIRLAEAA